MKFIELKSIVKKQGPNITLLASEKIFKAIIGMVSGILMANYLGASKYGDLVIAESIIGITLGISNLGLDSVIVRDLIRKKENYQEILGTGIVLRLTISAVAFLVLVLMFGTINIKSMDLAAYIMLSTIPFFQSFQLISKYFESKSSWKLIVIPNTLGFFVSNILIIIFVIANLSLTMLVFAILIQYIVTSALMVWNYFFKVEHLGKLRLTKSTALELMKDSWPLIPHNMSYTIVANVDQIMIGSLLGSREAGIYGMAYKILMKLYDFLTVFTRSMFPLLVKKSTQSTNVKFEKFYKYIVLIVLITILLYYSVLSKLLLVFIDVEYIESISILNYLIIALFFLVLNAAIGKWYIIQNLTRALMVRTISSAALNIVLNYFLIKHFGIFGAVLSTIITVFYLSYLSNYLFSATTENAKILERIIIKRHEK